MSFKALMVFFNSGPLFWTSGGGLRCGTGGSPQGVPSGHLHRQQQVIQAVLPLHFLPGTVHNSLTTFPVYFLTEAVHFIHSFGCIVHSPLSTKYGTFCLLSTSSTVYLSSFYCKCSTPEYKFWNLQYSLSTFSEYSNPLSFQPCCSHSSPVSTKYIATCPLCKRLTTLCAFYQKQFSFRYITSRPLYLVPACVVQ